MDKDGYPDNKELRKIEKWDYKDIFNLIQFVKERWAYADWGWKEFWGKDGTMGKYFVFNLHISTAGWSGNESLINSLLKNTMFSVLAYTSWRRGGHYTFEINPNGLGWVSVQQYCKDKKVSRQYVYHNADKFDWLIATKNKRLYKKTNRLSKSHRPHIRVKVR